MSKSLTVLEELIGMVVTGAPPAPPSRRRCKVPASGISADLFPNASKGSSLFRDSEAEAVSALLRSRPTSYEEAGGAIGALAPFDLGSLSLPETVVGCPNLVDVLSPEARKFIDGWESLMLNSPGE